MINFEPFVFSSTQLPDILFSSYCQCQCGVLPLPNLTFGVGWFRTRNFRQTFATHTDWRLFLFLHFFPLFFNVDRSVLCIDPFCILSIGLFETQSLSQVIRNKQTNQINQFKYIDSISLFLFVIIKSRQ